MNERIQELATQAFFETDYDDAQNLPETMERFAELIVQECLNIVNRKEYSYHEADPLWETAQLIRNHFGVKE